MDQGGVSDFFVAENITQSDEAGMKEILVD